MLNGPELEATAAWIASLQLGNGMIPWFPGGHADPWNHTEAAMALVVTGRVAEAESAYRWLASTQLADGSWCLYHLAEGIEEPRRDPNVCAYVATGVWWHYLETGDVALLERMWPVVGGAVEFVLGLQEPGGEVLWKRDVDGRPGSFALLTANASMYHSLRCALAMGNVLGHGRPEWEMGIARVGHAVAQRRAAFERKDRGAMDWYYPVLSGAVTGGEAVDALAQRWEDFVIDGVGVRCVGDEGWVTTAETAECVMALDAAGLEERAITMLGWTRHLRHDDGSYWTGCVHPQCVRYPGGERSSYGAAAVIMAHHVLSGRGGASGLFRGEGLPAALRTRKADQALASDNRVGDVIEAGRTSPLPSDKGLSEASAEELIAEVQAGRGR